MNLGLALSGGGAKGAAHIGVLKAFEEEKIKINYIGGTSSGSIVATLYAAGYKADDIYYNLKATVYYPGDDESWKGIENEDVGGDITWKPYEKNAIEGVYEGCKWVYNLDSKTFTISSNDGKPVEIPDFESYEDTPWAQEAKEEIEKNCKTIIIADDITRVGNASFGKLFAQVENITFSQNLKSIGKDAFVACGAGTKKAPQFTLPDSLETIEDGAFASLEEFTEITIPKEVKELASTAFLGCNKLTTVKCCTC